MKSKLVKEIKRVLWCPVILATLIIGTILSGSMVPGADCAAAILVTRDLPDTISIDETVNVTITFNAPADDFVAIGLSDFAPTSWIVAADAAWCTPHAMDAQVTGNRADYIWAGPYTAGTEFTAVFQATVPGGTNAGTYSFSNGVLEYYLGANPDPYTADVTGDYQVEVAVINEDKHDNSTKSDNSATEQSSPEPVPGINSDEVESESDIVNTNEMTELADLVKKEIADKQMKNSSTDSVESDSQAIPPAPTSSEDTLLYPPEAKDRFELLSWPVLGGIIGGVVVITVFLFFFRLMRRLN